MLEYRDKTVQEVAACICDRCQKLMTAVDGQFEWQERLSISFRGGYGSIFGDGHTVSVDLCQQCIRETLGQWLRITPPGADGLKYQEQLRSEWDGREVDLPRSPRGLTGRDDT